MVLLKKYLILIVGVLAATQVFAAGVPHTSYGTVSGTETSTTCAWTFYVVTRPAETLTGKIAYASGTYYWQALAGNLTTPWNLGEDSMIIVKKDKNSGTSTHTAFYAVMNEDLSNEFPQAYNACTLREIPAPSAEISADAIKVSWSAAQTDASQTPRGNNVAGYNVYRSLNGTTYTKINVALVTTTAYTDNNANSEPDPVRNVGYYYAIEPVFRGPVALGYYSANSNQLTYPAKSLNGDINLNLHYNAASGNVFWISTPYISNFSVASDIVAKINTDAGLPVDSGNKVTQIGRWDPATQQYVTYDYLGFLGWSGTNFSVVTGEAVFLNIAADVAAMLPGTLDPNFVFNLTHNAAIGNIFWISLPKTFTYSDVVSIISDINTNAGKPADSGDIVSQVGCWNGATQAYETYDYLGFLGWSGTDFNFVSGEGYFLNLAANVNNWKPQTY